VLGHVEREARLADAGPGGEDDEVARLEAGGELVQVRETGRDADDLTAVFVEVIEPVVGAVERVLRGLKLSPVRRWLTAKSSASDRSIDSWMSAPSS